MYLRGNSAMSVAGAHTVLQPGLELRGTAAAPASAAWSFSTPLRRLAVGLRFRCDDGLTGWILTLDGTPLALRELPATRGDRTVRHALAECDLPERDPHRTRTLELRHTGPTTLCVEDLIVRTRALGDDPIGDELMIEEGRYWSAWVQAHVDAGDRSIADGQVKATHPSFLPNGVLAPDRRDVGRRFGFWPDSYTEFMLRPFREKRGGIAVDLGTGCGQFALQAARQGLCVVGVDLGAGLLAIARGVVRRHPQLDLHYVRAESLCTPLAAGRFDVVAAKESLHHLDDPCRAMGEVRRLLAPGGVFIASEHLYTAPWLERLLYRITMLLRPRVVRRHPIVPVPPVLAFPSPLEDAGCNGLSAAFHAAFRRRRSRPRWMIVDLVEMHVHYGFGRWRWLARPLLVGAAYAVELAVRVAAGRFPAAAIEGRDPVETRDEA